MSDKDAEIASLLNTLADARTESMRLRARVTELEGQHKGMVLNNAILRERPDLPLNRIPAARAMTKLYEDNERLRAALLTPLTEDEGVWIERRAAELFWQWKRPSGPRVQVIMAQDGIEYWTVKATHEALQARAALEEGL